MFQTSDFDQAKLYYVRKGKMTTAQAMTYITATVGSRYPGNAGWALLYTHDMSYEYPAGTQVCQKGYGVLVTV